jgi:hypothetical protein
MGRILVTYGIAAELHPTAFGVCIIFYRGGKRVGSLSCEPNLANSLKLGDGPVEPFSGTLLEAIDKVREHSSQFK